MSLFNSLDRNNNLSELNSPRRGPSGLQTAAARKIAAQTNLGLQSAGTLAGDKAFTGIITPTGGIVAAGGFAVSPRCWHTGGTTPAVNSEGTSLDTVNTELYLAEIWVPCNASVTGVAIFNGTAVAGNVKVMIFDSAGARKVISATTAQSGNDAFQRVAFAAPYAILGPATYYIGVMGDTSGDINTHIFGNFGAGKITTLVYATEAGYAAVTVPTTFTTGLGPMASLY